MPKQDVSDAEIRAATLELNTFVAELKKRSPKLSALEIVAALSTILATVAAMHKPKDVPVAQGALALGQMVADKYMKGCKAVEGVDKVLAEIFGGHPR